ncbi:hypothetical protein HHI36_015020 [Cryptolaemus montrouzieri]|uniref:Zinc phosphodiesterase ELAC protein 2 n=2 Tax=Cryptolaemus montrouzieri TaxID=559131 RepID=A0ABD2N4R7_9CUCU
MPKHPKHLGEIQNQRNKNKQKLSKFAPGKVTLQVLGTGTKGAPRSLYVFSDQSRYLFNCGEGTQRLAHELKLKLAKLEHIFITHPSWQNIGGLPGITLTMQDVGVPSVNIHGPTGLQELFHAAKKFVILKNMDISFAESNPKELFEDNVLKVQYVALKRHLEALPNEFPEDEHMDDIDISHGNQLGMNEDEKVDETTATGKHKRSKSISSYLSEDNSSTSSDTSSNSSTTRSNDFNNSFCVTKDKGISMCYVCRLQPRPGALCLEKCVALGVPPGPLLGKLKSGEDVTLQDGRVVESKQVCEPDDPGPIFIVVDCPTEEYISSLIDNDVFKKYQKFAENDEDAASVVVHFTPKRVMDDPRYQSWMKSFLTSTQHLILNETNTCMGSIAVHRIQHKLNMIHPKIFPLLGDNGTKVADEEILKHDKSHKSDGNKELNVLSADTLTAIHLRPRKGLDRSEEIRLKPKEYINETLCIEGFSTALHDVESNVQISKYDEMVKEYPKVLFLGTGSCIPNKTRNTSGIILETGKEQRILLDCGEGTYGQIVRFFGKSKCDEVLSSLKAVYISHIHADHHIGLIGVLQNRRRALKHLNMEHEPVILLAPIQLYSWLSFYDHFFERIKDEYEFVSNSDLLYTGHRLNNITYDRIIQKLNMQEISTCFVKHCPNAFGIAFSLEDGSKITYSGDTMPCNDLTILGRNSDLLIHEATMEDDLEHEALIKMHSTTTQAIEIGKKMEAKYILLTHFSQRYAKLPRFNENFADNVGIAFDNMQVRMDDLPSLPHFNSALRLMFAEHYDEMEQKAMKRQLRNEKENESNLEKHKILKTQ